MANSVDPDQTAPIGAVCSWSTLFASILNSLVMPGNYLQQTTSSEKHFSDAFFLGALRVKRVVLLLLIECFLLHPLIVEGGGNWVIGPCFVMQYLVSLLVLK